MKHTPKPLSACYCISVVCAFILCVLPSFFFQVRTTLSSFAGEELSKVKEQLDALAQCFQLEDDEEEAGGKEGKSERIEEMKKLVEGFGSKVKVDRLLKVRPRSGLFIFLLLLLVLLLLSILL